MLQVRELPVQPEELALPVVSVQLEVLALPVVLPEELVQLEELALPVALPEVLAEPVVVPVASVEPVAVLPGVLAEQVVVCVLLLQPHLPVSEFADLRKSNVDLQVDYMQQEPARLFR